MANSSAIVRINRSAIVRSAWTSPGEETNTLMVPRDGFTSGHRHFAKHVIDCDASQPGAACGKVFVGCAEENARVRVLFAPPKRAELSLALKERVKGRSEVKVESSDAG